MVPGLASGDVAMPLSRYYILSLWNAERGVGRALSKPVPGRDGPGAGHW